MNPEHDVLIVGGGLVGASMAIALSHLPLNIALVEPSPLGQLPEVFDQRNLSLAAASINALTALGVIQHLQMSPGFIRQIHISRAGDFGQIHLRASDYGPDAFGQVIMARDFGQALAARLQQLPQLQHYRPARFVRLGNSHADYREVVIAQGDQEHCLRTRLLVAADGSHSAVRHALAIKADTYDYAQSLLVARVRAAQAADGRAWERLTDSGPTALLPRGDGYYGVVHGVQREQADEIMALDDSDWLARLQNTLGWRAGRLLESGPRSAYPLVRIFAQQLTADRVVLLGNAAQSLHPLGAQGFNLGLRDALTLAEHITQDPLDAGASELLRSYVQTRQADRQRTAAFSDGLARITSNPSPLLRPFRSIGLAAFAQIKPLQAWLVGGAMGFRGNVPKLCRNPT